MIAVLVVMAATWAGPAWSGEEPVGGDGGAVDRLVALMAERLALAEPVARAKWASGRPIEDLPREQAVIAAAVAAAQSEPILAPALVAAFMQGQITASKLVQRDWHDRWRAAGVGPGGPPPNLAGEIRPALDRIGADLPKRLAEALPVLAGAAGSRLLAQAAEVHFGGFPASVRESALGPLRALGVTAPPD